MSTFSISITIDDQQTDAQQVERVREILCKLSNDLTEWRALIDCAKLRDKSGNVLGQAWVEDGLDY